jgi:threonine dehydratase
MLQQERRVAAKVASRCRVMPRTKNAASFSTISATSTAEKKMSGLNNRRTVDRMRASTQLSTASDGEDEEVVDRVAFPGHDGEQALLLSPDKHAVGYLSKILNARVYDACIETDLQHAHNLSAEVGNGTNHVYLKREDQQPVFSFKLRGAYNKMSHLTEEQMSRGVVCCSAGNHAQGVAKSATILGCKAVIVMPLATPSIKVNAVRMHGGENVEVKLFGQNYDESAAEAKRLQEQHGYSMIHPFNDPYVIAGQGTIGVEILKEMVSKPLEYIFVCCGGGGMLAGIAAYVKRVRPHVKVIGVEAADAAGMTESLREGRVTTLKHVGLFADGAAVKTVGDETFRVCQALVDDMVTVTTDQICNAIKLSYNDARVVLEPAGALAVAGMKKYVEENGIENATMVATTSGANMDFTRLRFVSERADDSERMLAVTIPERPGTFRELYDLVWPRNVTEFSYRYDGGCSSSSQSEEGAPSAAHILISFQPLKSPSTSSTQEDFEQVLEKLKERDFESYDLTNNGLAKDHVRHMAGGRSNVPHERLFRFDFPESPGALKRFFESLDMDWNVSLFHYRNHGDDYGRVLCGIQVPELCDKNLKNFLEKLGYNYAEETDNNVYTYFLQNGNTAARSE